MGGWSGPKWVVVLPFLFFAVMVGVVVWADNTRPRQVAAAAGAPDEAKLYVHQPPDKGFQTVFVIGATGDGEVEACYLVPVKVAAPGKKADLDKKLSGRLLTAELQGRDDGGRLKADFWLGKKEGGWLSGRK